jgi:hypothetical protein
VSVDYSSDINLAIVDYSSDIKLVTVDYSSDISERPLIIQVILSD